MFNYIYTVYSILYMCIIIHVTLTVNRRGDIAAQKEIQHPIIVTDVPHCLVVYIVYYYVFHYHC